MEYLRSGVEIGYQSGTCLPRGKLDLQRMDTKKKGRAIARPFNFSFFGHRDERGGV